MGFSLNELSPISCPFWHVSMVDIRMKAMLCFKEYKLLMLHRKNNCRLGLVCQYSWSLPLYQLTQLRLFLSLFSYMRGHTRAYMRSCTVSPIDNVLLASCHNPPDVIRLRQMLLSCGCACGLMSVEGAISSTNTHAHAHAHTHILPS